MRSILQKSWVAAKRTVCPTRPSHSLRRHKAVVLVISLLLLLYLYSGQDGVSKVDRLPKPTKVLIVSYRNAGSTFIGSILQRYPGSFYHREPLKNLEIDSSDGQTIRFLNETSRRLIPFELDLSLTTEFSQNVINCHHEKLDIGTLSVYYYNLDASFMRDTKDFFMCHGRHWYSNSLDYLNTRLAFINSIIKEESRARILHCLPLLTDKCKAANIRIFEFTQLRMAAVKQLLDQNYDVKVIYLIRDPRAIIEPLVKTDERDSERRHLYILRTKEMCLKISEDLNEGNALQVQYPDRFLAIRYEDYIEDSTATAETIFKFIGEALKDSDRTTHDDGETELGTPPSDTLWRERLDQRHLTLMNDLCEEVYRKAGYIKYDDINDIRNLSKQTYINAR